MTLGNEAGLGNRIGYIHVYAMIDRYRERDFYDIELACEFVFRLIVQNLGVV